MSYPGISGVSYDSGSNSPITALGNRYHIGPITVWKAINTNKIPDGLSNTLLTGERPPAPDLRWGWFVFGGNHTRSGPSMWRR